jgi:uncharacterized glyoxalase superfamily protein PhnB
MTKTKEKAKPATTAKPAAKGQGKATPSGTYKLFPHIVCRDAAKAIDFYKNAFGAVEMMRLPGPGGKLMHGAIQIGGATVMLVDEAPEWKALSPLSLNGTPVTLHLQVDDVDAVFARAVKAGATVRMPVTDMFWGDRYGMLVDPFGHSWSIATHLRDMTIDEIKAAMMTAGPGPGC